MLPSTSIRCWMLFLSTALRPTAAVPHVPRGPDTGTTSSLEVHTYARPYSSWMADSAIARGQANGLNPSGAGTPYITYENGLFQRALYGLYTKTGNTTYYTYIKNATDRVIGSDGSIGANYVFAEYQLDHLKLGETFIYLYQKTGNAKYKAAAANYRLQLQSQPRTREGGFWHKQRYPNQQWLDGQYMGLPFYADYAATLDPTNTTVWSDILLQLKLVHTHCLQNTTGLLYHGYDASLEAVWANPVTGASPEVWDRALGWWSIALVDLLDYVPTSQTALRSLILTYITELATTLKTAADSTTGVWWLVMSEPGRTGNYFESSAAAMFTTFFYKAVRLGYISKSTYLPVANKAYAYMVDHWVQYNSDGTISWLDTVSVGSLSGDGTFEYYISVDTVTDDLKGLSPFILASLEYEKL